MDERAFEQWVQALGKTPEWKELLKRLKLLAFEEWTNGTKSREQRDEIFAKMQAIGDLEAYIKSALYGVQVDNAKAGR